MSVSLPHRIDVSRLAKSSHSLQGEVLLPDCPRLRAAVVSMPTPIVAQLDFVKQADGKLVISGRVCAQVVMQCQRCLQPMSLKVLAPVSLGVVDDEAAADLLSEDLEPLIAEHGQLDLLKLVEDELLLALPIVALHDECAAPALTAPDRGVQEARRDNPFAALAGQFKG